MLTFKDFAGMSIFLIIADLVGEFLKDDVRSINSNIIRPIITLIIPLEFFEALQITIGGKTIHIGRTILDLMDSVVSFFLIYMIYVYTSGFKGMKK